ncbi:hypothetical protein KVT40_004503 [Elsinoe batatas]|uniref:Uncharacterized protein n=1 Tax=Elsinoe batatas TaxID=2601811 RepID=A0A8K0L178_9PEZI|nr:hypothetical protein KVT40_004503 [Elsinoe batatas]
MANSIPVFICGRIPPHVEGITRILGQHGYKVTRSFNDFDVARSAFPGLVADPATRPRAVVIGRGFSDEQQDGLIKAGTTPTGSEGHRIAWLVARPELMTPELKAKIRYAWDGNGPPPVEVLAGRIMESLRQRGIEQGGKYEHGIGEDGVFGF